MSPASSQTPVAGRAQAPRLIGVQYLRAIAALMVGYLHLIIQVPEYVPYLEGHGVIDTGRLKSGVDIFFVISGFIMLVTSVRSGPGDFAIRRIIRIVPLYWVLTLVLIVLALVHPDWFRTVVVRADYVIKSLLFIPYPNPSAPGELAPLLIPGWTLNFEMFFYAVFTLVLFSPLKWRVAITGLTFGALLALPYLVPGLAGSRVLAFYANPQIFEFWLGMAIGHAYLNNALRLPKAVSLALVVLGFAALLIDYSIGPQPINDWGNSAFAFMIPAAAIVLGVVALERTGGVGYNRVGALLGDASYSIYLTHIFTLGAVRLFWGKLGIGASPLAAAIFACVAMVLVCVGAVVTYRLVEQPLLHAAQGFYKRSRARSTSQNNQASVERV